MTSDCAVCYVSDLNFLLPSIISATAVRRYVPTSKADIYIFTLGVNDEIIKKANDVLIAQGIRVLTIADRVFEELDKESLSKTLTPLGTFGRFFMEDLLPASVRRIVYLDGDVLSVEDPTELIDAVIPEGRFAAAEDTIFFRQNMAIGSTAKEIKGYFGQLGLKPENGYFNAGVFAASRDTWREIANEAYGFFLENTGICKHFDQSALNAVMGSRRLRLSTKWNFQKQFVIWGAERIVQPRLYHFNRYPKPWMGTCDPWKEMFPIYQNEISTFSQLQLPHNPITDEKMAEFNAITAKTYAYLQWPGVSSVALSAMKFSKTERSVWL